MARKELGGAKKTSYVLQLQWDCDKSMASIENTSVCAAVNCKVCMKNAVFWDVMPCRSCVKQHFGGTYRLHLQGRKICEWRTSVSRRLQTVKCVYQWWCYITCSPKLCECECIMCNKPNHPIQNSSYKSRANPNTWQYNKTDSCY
jgi:hypothetical protein